jgi:hypothetical protein
VNQDARIEELESVLARFLQPMRGLPFPVVIKALAGNAVIEIDRDSPTDRKLIEAVRAAAEITGEMVRAEPIRRNRPNEVGNDIEPYVMRALERVGLRAERPKSAKGRGQQTGYPDILVFDAKDRPTYLECKIFGEGSEMTTMRSFYLSPSANPKICMDARHMLLAFGVERTPIRDTRDSYYRATSFKLVDLFALKCDVKYEFNADNARLYDDAMLLAQGAV